MRSRVRTRKTPFPAGWLLLGLLTCGLLFWLGAEANNHLSGGLSVAAMLVAFVALWVGPVLLAVTALWGGFAFCRWLLLGEGRR